MSADNLLMLKAIVNGAGITKLMRMSECGASRVDARIFWLEQTLLAFEEARLTRWREKMEASGGETRARIAHHVWSATLQRVSTFFNAMSPRSPPWSRPTA